jgi:hypothetical protein
MIRAAWRGLPRSPNLPRSDLARMIDLLCQQNCDVSSGTTIGFAAPDIPKCISRAPVMPVRRFQNTEYRLVINVHASIRTMLRPVEREVASLA